MSVCFLLFFLDFAVVFVNSGELKIISLSETLFNEVALVLYKLQIFLIWIM